jgi:hypothetical protein
MELTRGGASTIPRTRPEDNSTFYTIPRDEITAEVGQKSLEGSMESDLEIDIEEQ